MEPMMSQAMVPATFFYHTEPGPENRQHMQFTSHPGFHEMHLYPAVPTLGSSPVYPRPGSSSQQPPAPARLYGNAGVRSAMTPIASPRLVNQRPTIILETELGESEGYPSTPPLSSSSSVISSPGNCDMLQTPLNPMFSGLDGFEGKDAAAGERVENLSNLDWSSCASPPMTPVYLQSQTQAAAKAVSLPSNINTSNDLLATTSCPSLSPSPSLYARSIASDVDFCDPRDLTVGTVNSTLAPEYSALPATFCAGDEAEGKFHVKSESLDDSVPTVPSAATFEFHPSSLHHGLPGLDEQSDFGESEDEFVNGLVNLGDHQLPAEATRSRASSDAASLGHDSFVCEDLEDFEDSEAFATAHLPSPPLSCRDGDEHHDKRIKMSDGEHEPAMDVAADSEAAAEQQMSGQGNSTESGGSKNHSNSSSSGSENTTPAANVRTPTNRRGRKQSLTEDPSKTFICDICTRRFRRQEHLKRHYRSLHTQEKPFECPECGKKFSRSDNLAQHARTHGSGAIVMNLINDHEAMAAAAAAGHPAYGHHHMMGPVSSGDDYQGLGKVLFQVASEVPGSASELSSDDGSSDDGSKKRKRVD